MAVRIPIAAGTGTLVAIVAVLCSPVRAGLEEGVAAYQAGNLPLAVKEFRTAAEAGDANCQYNLALMYEQGIGVGKDEKDAVVWYRKSAEQGNSHPLFNLGVLYENGRGTAADFAEANRWYRKAAVQGDALAIGNLGMLYLRGDSVNRRVREGGSPKAWRYSPAKRPSSVRPIATASLVTVVSPGLNSSSRSRTRWNRSCLRN